MIRRLLNEVSLHHFSVSALALLAVALLLPCLAAAQTPGHLYVAAPNASAVYVVDTSTNTLVTTIPILPAAVSSGQCPNAMNINHPSINFCPDALAITPDGKSLYLVNETCAGRNPGPTPGTVFVIDIAPNSPTYNTVIATIGVGSCPTSLAFSPDGTQAYVTNFQDGTISVIDTQTHAVTSTINAPHGSGTTVGFPESVATNPLDGFVYLADRQTGLDVISPATNTVVLSVDNITNFKNPPDPTVAVHPADDVTITPNGQQAWVVSSEGGDFYVLNLPLSSASPAFVLPVATFCTPGPVVFSPDGQHAYIPDIECGGLGVADAGTFAFNFIPKPSSPFLFDTTAAVAVSPDSSTAYLAGQFFFNASSTDVFGIVAIDTATLAVPSTVTIPLSSAPGAMAFAPANTSVGGPVTVQPKDLATGTTPVTVTFSNITQPGFTGLTISSAGPTPPAGFSLGSPAVYYELTTSAQYPTSVANSITVCVNYSGTAFAQPPTTLFHFESGAWVALPTTVDTTNMIACGTASSLSPFAIFQPSATTLSTATSISAPGVTYGTFGTAAVSVSSSSSTAVNGSVTLSVDGGAAVAAPLVNGSAIFNLGILNAGAHSLSANFPAQGNFSASSAAGTFSVSRAPLTVTASNATRPYGANNPVFTGTVVGLQNADPINATFNTTATPASAVGVYPITPIILDPSNRLRNYTIFVNHGALTVTQEPTTLTVTLAPASIHIGGTATATLTLTAPDMVIPIDPSVMAAVTLTSPVVSDILSNNGVCTPAPSSAPGSASCSITVTSVEPNGRTLTGNFVGSADLASSSVAAELMVTASLQSQQVCIPSDFRNVAVPGGSYLWFNSIFKVRDVSRQVVHVSFFRSSVQFQYKDTNGNPVTVNRALPDADITIDPNATAASTAFDAVNNVWLTTVPFDLDDNAFLTGMPWLVPPAGLPADVEPVTVCGTFASDVAGLDIGWRWAAAAYSSFSGDNSTLGVKPMETDHDNPGANHDHAGTPENFKQFVIPGARGKGGANFTGTYSRSAVIE